MPLLPSPLQPSTLDHAHRLANSDRPPLRLRRGHGDRASCVEFSPSQGRWLRRRLCRLRISESGQIERPADIALAPFEEKWSGQLRGLLWICTVPRVATFARRWASAKQRGIQLGSTAQTALNGRSLSSSMSHFTRPRSGERRDESMWFLKVLAGQVRYCHDMLNDR